MNAVQTRAIYKLRQEPSSFQTRDLHASHPAAQTASERYLTEISRHELLTSFPVCVEDDDNQLRASEVSAPDIGGAIKVHYGKLEMKVTFATILTSMALFNPQFATAGAGTKDLSFGINGEQISTLAESSSDYDLSHAVVAGPGGVTYQVGMTQIPYPVSPYFGWGISVVRYTHTGKLDPNFGKGGKLLYTDPNAQMISAYSADVDSSGRLVTAGTAYGGALGDASTVAVCRFTAAGNPDVTFGDDKPIGCKYVTWDKNLNGAFVKIDADGDILVAVDGVENGGSTVMKFSAKGQLVPSFNGGIADALPGSNSIWDMALTPEGDVVVAGYSYAPDQQAMIAKIDGNTGEMANFGNGGVVIFDPLPEFGYGMFNAVAVASDGSVLAGGTSKEFTRDAVIIKYSKAGKIDESFGVGGVSVVAVSDSDWTHVYYLHDLLIGGAGEIYAGMADFHNAYIADPEANPPQVHSSYVLRLDATGNPDSTYGNSGMAFASFSKPQLGGHERLAMQGERVLLAAQTYNGPWPTDTDPDFAIARFDHGIKKVAFTISPKSGANGTLKPALPVFVPHSDSREFQVVPKPGYAVDSVSGCNGAVIGSVYITGPAVQDCNIVATFKKQ